VTLQIADTTIANIYAQLL